MVYGGGMEVASSTRQQLWRRLLDQPCCQSAFAAKPASTRKGYFLRGIRPSAAGDSALQGLDRGGAAHLASGQRPGLVRAAPSCAALGAALSTSTPCADSQGQELIVAARLRASQLAACAASGLSTSCAASASRPVGRFLAGDTVA